VIDWWGLVHNALWVVGLAALLATGSVTSYQAQRAGVRLWQKLTEPGLQMPFVAGMVMVCLGLLFSSRAWWQQALWGLLAAAYAGQMVWLQWRSRSKGIP
jgi:hypothetical protein